MARLLMAMVVVALCYAIIRGIGIEAPMATVLTCLITTLGAAWVAPKLVKRDK